MRSHAAAYKTAGQTRGSSYGEQGQQRLINATPLVFDEQDRHGSYGDELTTEERDERAPSRDSALQADKFATSDEVSCQVFGRGLVKPHVGAWCNSPTSCDHPRSRRGKHTELISRGIRG